MKSFSITCRRLKSAFGILIISALATTVQAQNQTPSMEDISYALGVLFAKNLQDQGLESISTSEMAEGLSSQMTGTARLTPEQANEMVGAFMQAKQAEASAGYDAECQSFLAENASKDGIQTTASGLQYKHETVGEGESPTAASTVTVHYRGTLIDGTEFDSSYSRGEPISFP